MDNQPKESRLEEFITSPKKAMWKLALPMTFGMAVQAIYMLADTAFVGRMIGGTALAALGYVFPFLFINSIVISDFISDGFFFPSICSAISYPVIPKRPRGIISISKQNNFLLW